MPSLREGDTREVGGSEGATWDELRVTAGSELAPVRSSAQAISEDSYRCAEVLKTHLGVLQLESAQGRSQQSRTCGQTPAENRVGRTRGRQASLYPI